MAARSVGVRKEAGATRAESSELPLTLDCSTGFASGLAAGEDSGATGGLFVLSKDPPPDGQRAIRGKMVLHGLIKNEILVDKTLNELTIGSVREFFGKQRR